jgi:aryl-alcohol dehydrogenase-like predicted oxidoreductase
MQYTQFGDRGPRVSRIAFGNWSAGGDWGSVDRDAAIAATREALALGINLFDTARAYGFGAAEQLLGEALQPEIRSARESLVIATKGGLSKVDGQTVRDSSPAALRRDLEASLGFLGTDYVDIYQVHWPDPATPIATTAETLDGFVREGLVRSVGVSDAGQPGRGRRDRRSPQPGADRPDGPRRRSATIAGGSRPDRVDAAG